MQCLSWDRTVASRTHAPLAVVLNPDGAEQPKSIAVQGTAWTPVIMRLRDAAKTTPAKSDAGKDERELSCIAFGLRLTKVIAQRQGIVDSALIIAPQTPALQTAMRSPNVILVLEPSGQRARTAPSMSAARNM